MQSTPNESNTNIESDALSFAYWSNISNELSKRNAEYQIDHNILDYDDLAEHLKTQGYFISSTLIPLNFCQKLINGIDAVIKRGLSPTWALMLDEYWDMYRALDPLVSRMLGENFKFVTGNYVFVVPNTDNAGGWGVHRDLPLQNSLRKDGMPEIMSFWVALTDATPLNSCLYCVPASRDPNYPDNLTNCSVSRVEDIECLAVKAGQVIGLNHALLHWGSRSSSRGCSRRISLVFDMQRDDAQPYHHVRLDSKSCPTFEVKAAYVAHVILWLAKYNVDFSTKDISLAVQMLSVYKKAINLSASFEELYVP